VVYEKFKDDSLPQRYRAKFNKILLYGPPGTGKTTIGFYLANELQRPIEYVKVSDVISFKFGETLKNIADVFNEHKDSIIFIDEFDAFAKSRFDSNDVGELKRVVNSLIQTLDVLSGDRIVIVATNLVESIDPAILRRFPIKLNVPELTKTERQDFLEFLIKTSDMKIKLSKDEKALLENAMQVLGLKTIDAIKSLVDATLISAHVQRKKSISLNDIFETMLNDGTLDSASVKRVQETNVNLYNQILGTLNAKLPKTEIAELMGVHRNSLNNYAKQV
jgi:SpoVK/Ycf46/Vps4 family AAA+-type ATPase